MNDPHLNSIWRYVGPSPGSGELQRVIQIDDDSVISMSENRCWYGFKEQFLAQFQFVCFPAKK